MAYFLSFNIEGTENAQKGAAALLTAMKDLTPFWRDVFAPKYFAMAQDLFTLGGQGRGGDGRFKSGAWAALSPKYKIWKAEHYPGKPILVREGALRESVRWSGTVGTGGIFEPHPTYVLVGSSVPYGKYHQYGTKHMPARPFLPPPDPAIFAPLLQKWLLKTQAKNA